MRYLLCLYLGGIIGYGLAVFAGLNQGGFFSKMKTLSHVSIWLVVLAVCHVFFLELLFWPYFGIKELVEKYEPGR